MGSPWLSPERSWGAQPGVRPGALLVWTANQISRRYFEELVREDLRILPEWFGRGELGKTPRCSPWMNPEVFHVEPMTPIAPAEIQWKSYMQTIQVPAEAVPWVRKYGAREGLIELPNEGIEP